MNEGSVPHGDRWGRESDRHSGRGNEMGGHYPSKARDQCPPSERRSMQFDARLLQGELGLILSAYVGWMKRPLSLDRREGIVVP